MAKTTTRTKPAASAALPAKIVWRLRMACAERGVWTGAELRRLLEEKAGLRLSAPSVSALMTKQPTEIRLTTLAAICTALDCAPNDLIVVR